MEQLVLVALGRPVHDRGGSRVVGGEFGQPDERARGGGDERGPGGIDRPQVRVGDQLAVPDHQEAALTGQFAQGAQRALDLADLGGAAVVGAGE